MDISICIGQGLQRLPQMINIWVDTPLSRRRIERILSQVHRLSGRYLFQAFS